MGCLSMKKKIVVLVLAICLVVSVLSGCSGKVEGDSSRGTDSEEKLTAYVVDADGYVNLSALEEYNRYAEEGDKIEVVTFSSVDEMNQRLATEITAGKGPDIFLYTESELPRFLSYAEKGVFADLTPLMEKTGFSREKYDQNALQYGQINGKQRFLPLGITVSFCVTTKSLSEQYGLAAIGEKLSYQNYFDLLEPTGTRGDVFWFSEVSSFLYPLATSFIDTENLESHFDSDKFRTALQNLETVKKEEDAYFKACQDGEEYLTDFEMLHLKKLLFGHSYYSGARELQTAIENFQKHSPEREEFEIYPMRDFSDENSFTSHIMQMVAVNETCKDKEKAWKFVEYLLSDSVQSTMGESNILIYGEPVNLDARRQNKELWEKFAENDPALLNFIGKYYEMLDHTTGCGTITYNMEYFNQVFAPYYEDYEKGKITLEEFCRQLDNKTGIFLKENA